MKKTHTGCRSSRLSQTSTPIRCESFGASCNGDSMATSYTFEESMLVRYHIAVGAPSATSAGRVFSETPPRNPLSYCRESEWTLFKGASGGLCVGLADDGGFWERSGVPLARVEEMEKKLLLFDCDESFLLRGKGRIEGAREESCRVTWGWWRETSAMAAAAAAAASMSRSRGGWERSGNREEEVGLKKGSAIWIFWWAPRILTVRWKRPRGVVAACWIYGFQFL